MTFSRLLNYKVTLIIPDGEVLRLCAQLPWHTTKESHGYHGKVQVFKRKKADAGHLLDTIQMTGSRQFPMSILDHTTFLPRIVYLCEVSDFFFFCTYCKQIPCENQYGTGNEGFMV